MILFSHPTGNSNVRAAVAGLLNAEILGEFNTTVAVFPEEYLDKLAAVVGLREIKRRQYESRLKPYTLTRPWMELGRVFSSKFKLSGLVRHERSVFSIDSVYKDLDMCISSKLQTTNKLKAVYAYEDGALYSFRRAKFLGIQCLYDLPIGYWRSAHKLLEREQERWPDWAPTLVGFSDSEEKLARKDEELQLADRVFVASKFTASTLKDYPGALPPIQVIPYGYPPAIKKSSCRLNSSNRPLKLLFVGGLTQRKGLANLFEAVENLKGYVTLTVVGQKTGFNCAALDVALRKHHWIPSLPHADILKIMQEHDVLVFPSLFEGFGLVITEAMSQGTPVITTDRTAGPDLITHGNNGWLVEAGSTQALQHAIDELLQRPDTINKVSQAAVETARLRPWEKYGQELAQAIKEYSSNL